MKKILPDNFQSQLDDGISFRETETHIHFVTTARCNIKFSRTEEAIKKLRKFRRIAKPLIALFFIIIALMYAQYFWSSLTSSGDSGAKWGFMIIVGLGIFLAYPYKEGDNTKTILENHSVNISFNKQDQLFEFIVSLDGYLPYTNRIAVDENSKFMLRHELIQTPDEKDRKRLTDGQGLVVAHFFVELYGGLGSSKMLWVMPHIVNHVFKVSPTSTLQQRKEQVAREQQSLLNESRSRRRLNNLVIALNHTLTKLVHQPIESVDRPETVVQNPFD